MAQAIILSIGTFLLGILLYLMRTAPDGSFRKHWLDYALALAVLFAFILSALTTTEIISMHL